MTTEGFLFTRLRIQKENFSANGLSSVCSALSLGYYLREGDTMRSTKELRSARAAIFIGAILTVLAAAAIFFVMHMGDNKNLSERERQALAQTLYFPNPSENQQIGETESIVNNDPDHAVSIHYPVSAFKRSIYRFGGSGGLAKGPSGTVGTGTADHYNGCAIRFAGGLSVLYGRGPGLPPWYSR